MFYLLWWSIIITRWQHSAFGQVKRNTLLTWVYGSLFTLHMLFFICQRLLFLLRKLIYDEHGSDDAKYWSQYSHENSLNPNLTFSHFSLQKEIEKIWKRLQIHKSIKKDSTGLSWFTQGTHSQRNCIKNKRKNKWMKKINKSHKYNFPMNY